MMLTKAKCPACGGALELNPGLERGICVYCGSEFLVQEAIQKFKAEVDGLPTLQNMLIRAEQKLFDGDQEGAEALYEKILEGAPTCHEAWWGMFKVKFLRNDFTFYEGTIGRARAMIENLGSSREALRAIEYAPDDVKVFYSGEIERIKRKWEADLAPHEAREAALARRRAEQRKEDEEKEKEKENTMKGIGRIMVVGIVLSLLVVASTDSSVSTGIDSPACWGAFSFWGCLLGWGLTVMMR